MLRCLRQAASSVSRVSGVSRELISSYEVSGSPATPANPTTIIKRLHGRHTLLRRICGRLTTQRLGAGRWHRIPTPVRWLTVVDAAQKVRDVQREKCAAA